MAGFFDFSTVPYEYGSPAPPRRQPSPPLCPICLNRPDWSVAGLVRLDDHGGREPLERRIGESGDSWRYRQTQAYVVCPVGAGTDEEHVLPARYLQFTAAPIVIGIVGRTATGKSHLLAAMINRLMTTDVSTRFHLGIHPLDLRIHGRFMREQVSPLMDHRMMLAATPADRPVEFVDAFEIGPRGGERRAVAFFDVAGELLANAGENTENIKFMMAVNALIFVVDATLVPGFSGRASSSGDEAFDTILSLLHQVHHEERMSFLEIPTAIVVNKSDTIQPRYGRRLVTKYVSRTGSEEDEFDLRTVDRESEDVFALLDMNGGGRWLNPMSDLALTTLYLASATGTSAVDGYFPEERFRPLRVLRPLLTLLACHGLLGPEAHAMIAGRR